MAMAAEFVNPPSTRQAPRRVVIVGGGISGLAAAYTLARAIDAGARIEGHLIEAAPRLGGVIRTDHLEGFIIEAGPDSFLSVKPEAAELCRELGLGNALLGSNDQTRKTYILHRGRLVAMPDGLLMLVPTRLWPMVTTPLLPLGAKLKAAGEWFKSPPKNAPGEDADESVADFITRHFGRAMLENIAEPLLAGVYGGDSAGLSVRSVLPRFWEMERRHGSLTRAVMAARKRRPSDERPGPGVVPPPLFTTLKEGMEQMVGAIEKSLGRVKVHLNRRVTRVMPASASGELHWRVVCDAGANFEADALILALPAQKCAQLLHDTDPSLAASLAAVPYSSALIVSLAYNDTINPSLPPGFGFLVPQKENRNLLACTFAHRKFAGRAAEGKALLRCFLGGSRHPELLSRTDEETVALVRRELQAILGISAEPIFHRVYRWPQAMAQYTVGHEKRIKAVEQRLEKLPGIYLAGNTYGGIGISDCIRSGRRAAHLALAAEPSCHGTPASVV